ncbi:MAG: transglutaminase-like domain-containing protein [Peptostreptococcaceae bacterium]|nr:transglutaminase-like domain-containing protein [Peptostreptococcaceae bacterium]
MRLRTYIFITVIILGLSTAATFVGLNLYHGKNFSLFGASDDVLPIEKVDPTDGFDKIANYTPNDFVTSEEQLEALIRKQIWDFETKRIYKIDSTKIPSDRLSIIFENAAIGPRSIQIAFRWEYVSYLHENYMMLHSTMTYHTTPEQNEFVERFAERWAKENIRDDMTAEERVKTIHDYIINNSRYSLGFYKKVNQLSVHSSYTLVKEKAGVCEAYAILFQKLALASGVNSRFVFGDIGSTTDDIYHLWNMVHIDGKWYHIDVTNDEPFDEEDEEKANTAPPIYRFYLKSDRHMAQTHTWERGNYPKARKDYPVNYDAE